MIDERTEQLINRRLDGELTDAESLELDRLLIRSPEARLLMEDYQRLDGHAGEALQWLLHVPEAELPPESRAMAGSPPAGRARRWNWAMGVAVAAMIALLLAGLPSKWMPDSATTPSTEQAQPPLNPYGNLIYTDAPARGVIGQRNQQQRISRNMIGVMDESGDKIYLLEVQRKDTTTTPVSYNY